MKKFDLKEYTPILTLDEYIIFEHPKTFHHVMAYSTKRNGKYVSDQVAQWNMPGLASDGPVVVPPGFVRAVIKKLGVNGKKGTGQGVQAHPQVQVEGDRMDRMEEVPAPRIQYRLDVNPFQNWAGEWAQARQAVPAPAPGRGAAANRLAELENRVHQILDEGMPIGDEVEF